MAIELKIIDNSLPLEQTIKRIWHRNVFFIGVYALLMGSVFVGAIINRIYVVLLSIKDAITNNNSIRARKICKSPKIERWLCLIEENFWQITWLMLFFTIMFISKLIYHIGIILWWIIRKIVWPFMWFMLAFLFVMSIRINNKSN